MPKVKCTKAQVIAALKETKGTQFLAAKRLGVSSKTVQRYLDRYPDIREIVAESRGELVDTSELKLWQAVQDGQPWAIRMVLETQGRDRGYIKSIAVTGADGGPIEHVVETVVRTREEAAALLARLPAAGGVPGQ